MASWAAASSVADLARRAARHVNEAHIFEMVGYRDRSPGSQRMPPGLPVLGGRDVGDFLALLANRSSNAIAEELLALAACYIPEPPVAALKIYLGLEKAFGHLNRSDHAPFWNAGIPSIMWTDTSEFRNPHYHLLSDTPATLDYEFMREVAKLALARVILCQRATPASDGAIKRSRNRKVKSAGVSRPPEDTDIPTEIDFSGGTRGKFFRPDAKLRLPRRRTQR